MRIERTGPVQRLTPKVTRFLMEALRGVSLDEIHSAEQTRIDFSCLSGLLAIEMKSLEGYPGERTNNFVDKLRGRPDFPTFFGAVSLDAVFKNMEGTEQLRRAAIDRLGRAIVTHLKKANEQLRRHGLDYPRRNRLNVVVIVNEDHPEYDPESVGWVVMREFNKEDERGCRYSNIDAVLYLTERHGKPVDELLAFPIAAIHNRSVEEQPWKEALLEYVISAWARWNGRPLFPAQTQESPEFEAFEHIPDSMPQHEAWRLAYRRNRKRGREDAAQAAWASWALLDGFQLHGISSSQRAAGHCAAILAITSVI
jgi:hypothetical protein